MSRIDDDISLIGDLLEKHKFEWDCSSDKDKEEKTTWREFSDCRHLSNKQFILCGDADHPMELYENFRTLWGGSWMDDELIRCLVRGIFNKRVKKREMEDIEIPSFVYTF